MTYDWEFSKFNVYKEHEGEEDVVFDISWRLNARDGDHSASDWGILKVTYDPDGPDPFIPFDDLTEADIQGWCEDGFDVAAIKTALDAKVSELKNPTTEVLHPPWQNGG